MITKIPTGRDVSFFSNTQPLAIVCKSDDLEKSLCSPAFLNLNAKKRMDWNQLEDHPNHI